MADDNNPAFVGRFGTLNRLLDSLNSVRASLHCMRERADSLRKQSGFDFAYDQFGECVGRLDRPYRSEKHSLPVGTIDLHDWYHDVRVALIDDGADPGDVSIAELENAAHRVAQKVGRLIRFDSNGNLGKAFNYQYRHYQCAPDWCRKLTENLLKANDALDTLPTELLGALDRLQQTAWRAKARHDTLDPAQAWTADALVYESREMPDDILRRAFVEQARKPTAFDELNKFVESIEAYGHQLVAVRGEAPLLDTPEKQKRAGAHECVGTVAWLISQLGCAEWHNKYAADYGASITREVTEGSMEEYYQTKRDEEVTKRDSYLTVIRDAPDADELRLWLREQNILWTKAEIEKQRGRLFAEQGVPRTETDALTLGDFLSRLREASRKNSPSAALPNESSDGDANLDRLQAEHEAWLATPEGKRWFEKMEQRWHNLAGRIQGRKDYWKVKFGPDEKPPLDWNSTAYWAGRLGISDEELGQMTARELTDLAEAHLEFVKGSNSSVQEAVSPSLPTLYEVNPDLCRIRIDGKSHDVSTEAARMAKLLLDAAGEWVAMSKHEFTKPSAVFDSLPDSVKSLVERESGKGYRLRRAG